MKLAWAEIKGMVDLNPPFDCSCDQRERFPELGKRVVVDLHSVTSAHIFCWGCGYKDPPDRKRKVIRVIKPEAQILLGCIEIDEGPFDPNHEPRRVDV